MRQRRPAPCPAAAGQRLADNTHGLAACSFYDKDAPIYTMSRFLPPSKVQDAEITDSILGEGCVIRSGSTVRHSVVGLRTLVCENCLVEDALLMGADYYETLEECALIPGCLPMGLGESCNMAHASRRQANIQE